MSAIIVSMSASGDGLRPSFEKVADTRRESFRLFTWDRDIDEVDLVTSDGGSRRARP